MLSKRFVIALLFIHSFAALSECVAHEMVTSTSHWSSALRLASFASAFSVQDARPPGTVSNANVQRIVLGTYPVGSDNLTYELSIAPCGGGECPFQVRLLERQTELNSIDLEWVKASGKPAKEKTDESSGFGDPFETQRTAIAWMTGEDQASVSTIATTVGLTKQLNGLVVIQRAGFDNFKRSYVLYVAMGKKLTRAWHFEEGSGPTWSTLELTSPRKDGSQAILLFNGFRYPSDDKPDWLYFTQYNWNGSKGEMECAAGKHLVNVLLAGIYKTVAEARAAQGSASCLSTFWVLMSDAVSELPRGKFVLAAISAKKTLAERSLATVKGCAGKIPVSMVQSHYLQPEDK
jgi:hypothetical protein